MLPTRQKPILCSAVPRQLSFNTKNIPVSRKLWMVSKHIGYQHGWADSHLQAPMLLLMWPKHRGSLDSVLDNWAFLQRSRLYLSETPWIRQNSSHSPKFHQAPGCPTSYNTAVIHGSAPGAASCCVARNGYFTPGKTWEGMTMAFG